MRYKVRILGTYPRDFVLDGDFMNAEEARAQARLTVEEDRSDKTDTGYRVIALPEYLRADVTDGLVHRFLTKFRELNWPAEDPAWKEDQVLGGVSSFRAALDGGYEPDGQRWGLRSLWKEAKVRFRMRDDYRGGIWVRFTVYSNSIALPVERHHEICRTMIEVVEGLEGEFPVVGER